jgi:hypothetical protein
MATSLAEIAGFLREENLKFREVPEMNSILTGFQTRRYRAPDGDDGVRIAIALEEDGEFLKVLAPQFYRYPDGPHKQAVFQTLLQISWMTKMIQFEYDAGDGEIRAIIEFPLEDAKLTRRQLMRCVGALAGMADEYDPVIRAAIESGAMPDEESELRRMFEEMMAQRRRMRSDLGLEE